MNSQPIPPGHSVPVPTPCGPAPERADKRRQLKDLTREQLLEYVTGELGEKRFRAEQLFNWMYARTVGDFHEMTNLPKTLRRRLDEEASLHPISLVEQHPSPDGTVKLVFETWDKARIESVWIPNRDRNTLCVSSQVGCAMACSFCLTAKMGLTRHLSIGEITDQVVQARQLFDEDEHGRLTNVVMMGMGEPLHNYDNVVEAMRLMVDNKGLNLSNRKVTVSTSGLVPAIQQLGQDLNVMLAVSLNATTDEVRDELMPVNKRWNIATLMQTLRDFPLKQRKRITIEYVLLGGVNDTLDDARRLVSLLHGIPTKVNLIPWNPHPGAPYARPEPARVHAFQQYLLDKHLNALIRETRGIEAMAACGQLGKPGPVLPKRFRKSSQHA